MRQEIDDPRKYRVGMSGFSIRTGWGDEKRIVAKYPGTINPLDQQAYEAWLKDAEEICEQHNALIAERAVSDRLLEAAEIGYDFLKDRMDTAPINRIGQILAEVEAMRKGSKK